MSESSLSHRAEVFAALGDPRRLAIIDELAVSDRSPSELAERLGVGSNLLANCLDVLESAGLIERIASHGDGRRKYVRLVSSALPGIGPGGRRLPSEVLFVCTHNSARSQLAAALWRARTGRDARSAGTRPAARVHRGAVAAARRAGLSLESAVPALLGDVGRATQVVTVCDVVHEGLQPAPSWWHWSIPDPARTGTAAAFDRVVHTLDERIARVIEQSRKERP